MPLTLDQFCSQLTELGFTSAEELAALSNASGTGTDGLKAVAKQLIAAGKLTKFQATQIAQGKGNDLVLDNYVIQDKIGAGGMGVVYLAEHKKMGRKVALKILPIKNQNSDDSIERFQREVRAVARLSHQNIVTAYDANEVDGKYFFAMEYVQGRDLSSTVKQQGTFGIAEAIGIVRQAAAGLGYAHEQGVIHRDIKPANLLLDKNGTVKILDMGLARFAENSVDVDSIGELTQTGTIMGTVDYMSPEQALDTRSAGPQSDIYSLGCTLFYLLTGRPLFLEETVMKRIMAKQTQPPPALTQFCQEVPVQLESAFQSMVATAVDARYATMQEVVEALDQIEVSSGGSVALNKTPADAKPTDETKDIAPSKPTQMVNSLEFDTDPNTAQVSIQVGTDHRLKHARKKEKSKSKLVLWGGGAAAAIILVVILLLSGKDKPEVDGAGKVASATNGDQLDEADSENQETDSAETQQAPATSESLGDISGFTFPGTDEPGEKETTEPEPSDPASSEIAKTEEMKPGDLPPDKPDPGTNASQPGTTPPNPVVIRPGDWTITPKMGRGREPKPLRVPFDPQAAQRGQITWAKHYGIETDYENSIGMKFKLIPPGEFMMGFAPQRLELAKLLSDSVSHSFLEHSSPQQQVKTTRPIYMGMMEVSQKQYIEVMETNPSQTQPGGGFGAQQGGGFERNLLGRDHLQFPVDTVKWTEAIEFCNRLSIQESLSPCYEVNENDVQLIPEGNGYRLPTSAEWEYSALSGSESFYWFGDPPGIANVPSDQWKKVFDEWNQRFEWINKQPLGTNPVGTSQANHFGLLDMNGNTDEWCWDWYHMYEKQTQPLIDPVGPTDGTTKVLRGGRNSQYGLSGYMKFGQSRQSLHPLAPFHQAGSHAIWPGFRVVRVIPELTTQADEKVSQANPSESPPEPKTVNKDQPGKWEIMPRKGRGKDPKPAKVPFEPQQAQKHQRDWAKHYGIETDYENSIGMKFKLIPPGEFMMGFAPKPLEFIELQSPLADYEAAQLVSPQVPVTLTRPIYIGATEVTQKQYMELMDKNPSSMNEQGANAGLLIGRDSNTFPVDNLTWFEAVEFCNRLSRAEQLVPCYEIDDEVVRLNQNGLGYRLPTSAEWEFAAMSGRGGFFWFAEPPNLRSTPVNQLHGLYESWAPRFDWTSHSNSNGSHPVGEKPANYFGLHDVHGNLWEWCWDWFQTNEDLAKSNNVLIDPVGPESGAAKVIRGGSIEVGYKGGPHGLRTIPHLTGPFRLPRHPKALYWSGFRVVRVIPEFMENEN